MNKAVMQEIIDDDFQAEALQAAYVLPKAEGFSNGYKTGQYTLLTVAIGTAEQFMEMHRMVDIRARLNEGKTTQMKDQKGIRRLDGLFYTVRPPAGVTAILDDWNSDPNINIQLVKTKSMGIPGGWASVARYIGTHADEGNDLLISVGQVKGKTKDATASAGNWFDIMRDNYASAAPDMSEFGIFSGWKTPIDIQEKTSDGILHTLVRPACELQANQLRDDFCVGFRAKVDAARLEHELILHLVVLHHHLVAHRARLVEDRHRVELI